MISKLLQIAPHEAENPTELSLRQAFELLEPKLRPPFPLTIPTQQEYSQLNMALLYGVLSEPHFAKTHIKHLHGIVTDGYAYFVSLVVKLVNELYSKLVGSVKIQLIWIVKEMVDVCGVGIECLWVSLLRQMVGGDFSDGNFWLCFELINVLLEKWDWLVEEESMILTSALFVYLRMLSDHCRLSSNLNLEALKQMEIDFCVRVLREKFHLCLKIGRDLVRLLQDLVHVPEFHAIWKDLLLNPGNFRTPGFSDISQLYRLRTSSRYFLLRVTPEMEAQLRFLLTHVKFGSQRRYQAWFARKFLFVAERETLICDIVRFICCAHHPSNEIIQSEVIPRWAVIGWLLKSCQKNYVEANVKLALFYDWLSFDYRIDNIMNIEPAMLLMVHSIPKYIDITHNLLEFLFLLADNYDSGRSDIIIQGVSSALSMLVKKGVVNSLDVLTSSDSLSPIFKERLRLLLKAGDSRESQPALTHVQVGPPLGLSTPCSMETKKPLSRGLEDPKCVRKDGICRKAHDVSNLISNDQITSHGRLLLRSDNQVDYTDNLVENIGENLKKSYTMGLQSLDELLSSLVDPDTKSTPNNGEVISGKLAKVFEMSGHKLFSPLEFVAADPNRNPIIQSATALVVRKLIFFCQTEQMQEMFLSWSRSGFPVRALLLCYSIRLAYEAQLAGSSPNYVNESVIMVSDSGMPLLKFHCDGYINYMKNRERDSHESITSAPKMDRNLINELVEASFSAYRCFLTYSKNDMNKVVDNSLVVLLICDLKSCFEWEHKRIKFIFQSIFSHFPDLSTGKEDIIRLLVVLLSHADVVDMQFELALRKTVIFGDNPEEILKLINSSLTWDPLEQHKFWGIIRAELAVSQVQVERLILEFFNSEVSDPNANSIAVGGLLALCNCRSPTPELVGALMLLRNDTFQGFSAAVLATLAASNPSMLFDSLVDFLDKVDSKNKDSELINSSGITFNHSATVWLLNYFEAQGLTGRKILSNLSTNILDRKSLMQCD